MGKYQRISKRASYSKETLNEAVREVKAGMSGYQASKIFKIPRMTIMDHVKNRRIQSTTLGRNTALSAEVEFNLATNLHLMEKYGFGLSRAEVLEMVADYIKRNNLITPFKNGVPGNDWFLAFRKRHGLTLKKPQAVEYARKKAIDPFIIYPYFDLLEKTIIDLNLVEKPSSIWNLDETSFSKDPSKTKIVGAKGHAATRVISSAGRDNTTVLLGASASGEKTPPLIVYKGKNVWDTWTSSEAYPGTSYAATSNGWMEAEVFESFFKKTFLPTIQGQRPVLLIYDGHSTHVGLNIIEEARKENITILKLPPHSSHILQPLDISVMKPFKDRWDALLVKWQRLNVGSMMPKSEFAKLIGQIWAEIDPQVLRNGFRKAGIYPVNRGEMKENYFDGLKLRHWREYQNKRNESIYKPKKLSTLTLNFFNECQIRKNIDKFAKNNSDELFDSPIQIDKVTFEDLLLQKVRHGGSSPKPQRRKIAPGAEVITHDDVLERKQQDQKKSVKKNKYLIKDKGQSQFSPNANNDVVYLSHISRNDCQLSPFSVTDANDLPPCLQVKSSDSPKIKILSNVLIKPPHTITQQCCKVAKPVKVGKENKVLLHTRIPRRKVSKSTNKQIDNKSFNTIKNLHDIPKPGPSGQYKTKDRRRFSSETTSVSGSISSYSDSDIVDELSDSITMIDDNEENTCNTNNALQVFSSRPSDIKNSENDDDDKENYSNPSYCAGDDVLVRYYIRQKWTYYVGQIEDIKIINDELFYSITFYKTIKTPQLRFRVTKRIDRDDVPMILVVKKVNLIQDPITLNYFFDGTDENSIYFSS